MTISEWLKDKFNKSGALQSEIADSAGITRDLMCRYVSGQRIPAVQNMVRLSLVLDFDLNELKNLEEFKDLRKEN
jgi:transcriptional regulator with XRE-family HTH domain